MIFKQLYSGGDRNFTYIIGSAKTKEVVVVDPSYDLTNVINEINKGNLTVKYIINTHSHPDHIAGNAELKRLTKAQIVLHEISSSPHDKSVKDDEVVRINDIEIKVLYTPGHIPDHICLLINNEKLITGDLLFVGKIGGTGPFFPGSDPKVEFESLKRILDLDENIEVYPGHDYGITKNSTIGHEKRTNPFLLRDNFNNFLYLKNHWDEYKKQHKIK